MIIDDRLVFCTATVAADGAAIGTSGTAIVLGDFVNLGSRAASPFVGVDQGGLAPLYCHITVTTGFTADDTAEGCFVVGNATAAVANTFESAQGQFVGCSPPMGGATQSAKAGVHEKLWAAGKQVYFPIHPRLQVENVLPWYALLFVAFGAAADNRDFTAGAVTAKLVTEIPNSARLSTDFHAIGD